MHMLLEFEKTYGGVKSEQFADSQYAKSSASKDDPVEDEKIAKAKEDASMSLIPHLR